jgi:hypothetical protein
MELYQVIEDFDVQARIYTMNLRVRPLNGIVAPVLECEAFVIDPRPVKGEG